MTRRLNFQPLFGTMSPRSTARGRPAETAPERAVEVEPTRPAVVSILTHGLVFCTDSRGVMQYQHLGFEFPACLWLDLFIHHNHSFPDLRSFYLSSKSTNLRKKINLTKNSYNTDSRKFSGMQCCTKQEARTWNEFR